MSNLEQSGQQEHKSGDGMTYAELERAPEKAIAVDRDGYAIQKLKGMWRNPYGKAYPSIAMVDDACHLIWPRDNS